YNIILRHKKKCFKSLITVVYKTLIPWDKKKRINTENKEALSRDPLVQKLINDDIVQLNKEFTNYAKPKRVTLISDEWSVYTCEFIPNISLITYILKK